MQIQRVYGNSSFLAAWLSTKPSAQDEGREDIFSRPVREVSVTTHGANLKRVCAEKSCQSNPR